MWRALGRDPVVRLALAFFVVLGLLLIFPPVDRDVLGAPIIEAKFLNVKDGKSRNLMYYAKFGRGLMARWIMQEQVDRRDGLKDFNLEGYKFVASESSETLLVFSRTQPPPKS